MIWMLLALTACTGDDNATNETGDTGVEAVDWSSWAAEDAGPYNVGHTTIEHTYTAFEGDAPRTITIEVWYPTEDTTGDLGTYVYGTDEAVFEGATPAAPVYAGGYPVHLHSHGFQGWGATSAFLMRHFASHGWVAVAPNHVGNLLADHSDPLYTAHYIHKLTDLQQSLDIADGLELAGDVNTDEVVLSGHSFGASYGTWGLAGASFDNVETACETGEGIPAGSCTDAELAAFTSGTLSDDRVKVAIPMAGSVREAFFGSEGYKAVTAPVLFVSGSNDNPDSNQAHWDTVSGIDFSWVNLDGGCHQTFALGQCETLDVPLGYTIVQGYTMAFARTHLLGADVDGPLLSAESQPWPEATLLVK